MSARAWACRNTSRSWIVKFSDLISKCLAFLLYWCHCRAIIRRQGFRSKYFEFEILMLRKLSRSTFQIGADKRQGASLQLIARKVSRQKYKWAATLHIGAPSKDGMKQTDALKQFVLEKLCVETTFPLSGNYNMTIHWYVLPLSSLDLSPVD